MVFAFDAPAMSDAIRRIAFRNLDPKTENWLDTNLQLLRREGRRDGFLHMFSAIPRRVGKELLVPSAKDLEDLSALLGGFRPEGWTRDRWIRAWWLLQVDPSWQERYVDLVESLFVSADLAELECLYSCLPLYAYPESFRQRCAEGIRNNIATVLDAVMLDNPYPSGYLDEAAWNQMMVKAFFTGKPIRRIQGWQQRSNPELACMLHDYAKERRAAGRTVPYLIWYLIFPYLGSQDTNSIRQLLSSPDPAEKEAGCLMCRQSEDPALQALLAEIPAGPRVVQDDWFSWMNRHQIT